MFKAKSATLVSTRESTPRCADSTRASTAIVSSAVMRLSERVYGHFRSRSGARIAKRRMKWPNNARHNVATSPHRSSTDHTLELRNAQLLRRRTPLMARVAINGLGRIGRATLKIVLDAPDLDLIAANDLGTSDD